MKKHLKSFIGFPFGAMMLIISYIVVYIIDGEATYLDELAQLGNIKYLIIKLIYSGIIYTIIFEYISLYSDFYKKYSKKVTWKAMIKFISATLLMAVFIPLTTLIPDVDNAMSGEAGTMIFGLCIIFLIFSSVVNMIYQSVKRKKEEKTENV